MTDRKLIIKKLILQVFEKAEKESGVKTNTGLSEYISDKIDEGINHRITGRSIRRIHKNFNGENLDSISEPYQATLDALSQYLKFADFFDFKNNEKNCEEYSNYQGLKHKKESKKPIFKNLAIAAAVGGATMLGIKSPDFIRKFNDNQNKQIPVYDKPNPEINCMHWNKNEFQLIDCGENFASNPYKVIARNEDLLLHFRQIENTDTLTEYAIGRFWYNKENHKIYVFTMEGKNPDSGKELHPISQHIFDKYFKK